MRYDMRAEGESVRFRVTDQGLQGPQEAGKGKEMNYPQEPPHRYGSSDFQIYKK